MKTKDYISDSVRALNLNDRIFTEKFIVYIGEGDKSGGFSSLQ